MAGACQNSFSSMSVLEFLLPLPSFPPTVQADPPYTDCEPSLKSPVISHFCCCVWAECAPVLYWEAKWNTKASAPHLCPFAHCQLDQTQTSTATTRLSCITRGWDRPPCTPRAVCVPARCTHTLLINRAQPHLLSTCCCSSCTFLHTSPAMAQVLPTLVKSAATLSVRRKPAALRFSMCRRHASTTPVGRDTALGPACLLPPPGQHHLLTATGQLWVRNRAGGQSDRQESESDEVSVCLMQL